MDNVIADIAIVVFNYIRKTELRVHLRQRNGNDPVDNLYVIDCERINIRFYSDKLWIGYKEKWYPSVKVEYHEPELFNIITNVLAKSNL